MLWVENIEKSYVFLLSPAPPQIINFPSVFQCFFSWFQTIPSQRNPPENIPKASSGWASGFAGKPKRFLMFWVEYNEKNDVIFNVFWLNHQVALGFSMFLA